MFLSESLERLRGVKAANLDLETHFRGRFPNARRAEKRFFFLLNSYHSLIKSNI